MRIAEEIIAGRRLGREDDLEFLLTTPLNELTEAADHIRRALCGNHMDLCVIINGRQGGCSENCRFCSQSAHNHSGLKAGKFLTPEEITADGEKYDHKGADRYSIVTAGRGISRPDLKKALSAYSSLHVRCPAMILCASHGIISDEDLAALKMSGVTMYHENIETSRRYFPEVCTTHSFDEKLDMIARAKSAGLSICCGGIIGMGETWEDRMDMGLTIAEIGADSIPINALMPIPGTPFGDLPVLSEDEILRSIALFRFLNPTAGIRVAAGRILMREGGRRAFLSGANAALTGEMLTTAGNDMDQDLSMFHSMGFELRAFDKKNASDS